MRQQRFAWAFLALGIVLTAYGGFSVVSSLTQNKGLSIAGLAFLIAGAVMLLLFVILALVSKRKSHVTPDPEYEPLPPAPEEKNAEEKPKEESKAAPEAETEATKEPKAVVDPQEEAQAAPENEPEALEEPQEEPGIAWQARESEKDLEPAYVPRRSYGGTIYVKRLGYGPVLRIEDDTVLEMRSNTYYRIEGNYVKRSGGGPAFEISGNRIKSAYGSGLYEISGDSVSKTFGGHYASFSGNRLQTNDLREQYECTGSLNLRQKLTVVALLFGSY